MQIRRLDPWLEPEWESGGGLESVQYNTSLTNSGYSAEGLLIQQSDGQYVLTWSLWSQVGAANGFLRWQTVHRPVPSISLHTELYYATSGYFVYFFFIHRLI